MHKVSIIPRGIGALGHTIQRPSEDSFIMTRAELENRMAVLLGGCAAEYIVFNHLSTGAADDLAKVTEIARDTVTRYGMEEQLDPVAFDTDRPTFLTGAAAGSWRQQRYSDETVHAIELAVQQYRRSLRPDGRDSESRASNARPRRRLVAREGNAR